MKNILIIFICLLILLNTNCELFIDMYPVPQYEIDPSGLQEKVQYMIDKNYNQNMILNQIAGWINDNIIHVTDMKMYNKIDVWQTPEETYYRLSGDCEDKALLFAYLANRYYGYESILYIIRYCDNETYHMTANHNGYWYSHRVNIKHETYKQYSYEDALIIAEYIR